MTETKKPAVKKTATKATTKTVAAKTSQDELMKKHLQMVQFVQNVVWNIETDLKRVKLILSQLTKFDPSNPDALATIEEETKETIWTGDLKAYNEEDMEIVEGKFDWYFMIGADQKKYPVPLNYSSKTKLVPGDILKLKILDDGKFIYKLIQPVERKHIRALLSRTDDNKYIAMTDEGKSYFLNQAAVTFFKGKPGDELYILVNDKEEGWFAAIEAIIKK